MSCPPLIILTIDAGDNSLIRRWAGEGLLPTIHSIMQRGWFARTTGADLLNEHGIWLSLISGVSRGKHGYYSFRQLKPGTYELQTVTPRDIKVEPFWRHLQGTGMKVATIDAPDAFPIPGLEGIQLANWATHHNWDPHHPHLQPCAQPPAVLDEARRIFGDPMLVIEKQGSTAAEDRGILRRATERLRKKGELCRKLLARDRFDLVVVGLSDTHPVSHQFWQKFRPEHGSESNDLTHAIRDMYIAVDRELGALLKQLPQNANVVIATSAGLDDYFPNTGLIQSFMRQFGYQVAPAASGGAKQSGLSPMSIARKLIPESLRRKISGMLLSRDARERIVAEQFRAGCDWEKTRAFVIPSVYTSFVRVNLRGREPKGCVEPGAAYDQLLTEIENELRQLIDPETNTPAVRNVWRTDRTFTSGEPPVTLPDLFIEWKPGRFMTRIVHPGRNIELTQVRPDWFRNSDHQIHGFVAAAGPSIPARGDIGDFEMLELAPTCLRLLGQPTPPQMTFAPREDLVDAGMAPVTELA